MARRTPGKRKTDFSDETTERVLKVAKQMIRTDFGGKDPADVIRKKATEAGLVFGHRTIELIIGLIDEQVASCRKRAFPRIDEAIRRAGGEAVEERSP